LANATVDHMLSLIVFISAIIVFIGLFSQTVQTGLTYQQHRSLATKTSDLLDTMLLNPGSLNWEQNDNAPVCFGLQDPDFAQYTLNPFSLTRLASSNSQPVYHAGKSYGNSSTGPGCSLLVASASSVNYSTVSKMLGISNTYGFQLSAVPLLTISTLKVSTGAPLKLQVNVAGTGFPLSNSSLSYSLLLVNQDANQYPSYSMISGKTTADQAGTKILTFSGVNGESQSYAFVVYAYLDGLTGIGCYVNVPVSFAKSAVPMVDSFQSRTITIAHSESLNQSSVPPSPSQLNYNATFFILGEDYTLRQIHLDSPNAQGKVVYGSGTDPDSASLTLPANYGVVVVTYKDTAGHFGVTLMPWGASSMAFPVIFGANPIGQEWITTDLRQVIIGGIAYQAKLELWNIAGHQVYT
jgi:hypothetical protein